MNDNELLSSEFEIDEEEGSSSEEEISKTL